MQPRLAIIEGIMGSGKSTMALAVAERLQNKNRPAVALTEGLTPHPIRVDWDVPWSDMPPAELAALCLAKWRSFVDSTRTSDRLPIVDGQLFHGNLTSLFLLEADVEFIAAYSRAVVDIIRPLAPLLVYFHQGNIDRALRAVCDERGDAWVDYQVNWKLASPYAVRRSLSGFEASSCFIATTVRSPTVCTPNWISKRSRSTTRNAIGPLMST